MAGSILQDIHTTAVRSTRYQTKHEYSLLADILSIRRDGGTERLTVLQPYVPNASASSAGRIPLHYRWRLVWPTHSRAARRAIIATRENIQPYALRRAGEWQHTSTDQRRFSRGTSVFISDTKKKIKNLIV